MNKKTKKKTTVKKPNFFLWYTLGTLIVIWYKIKVRFLNDKLKIEKGSLIISPHRSYFDFFTVPISIFPKRVHVVSTTYWFRNKKLGKLLNILGVIPKDQYKSDIKAILKIGEVLKRGENVLLFPEGQMSPYANTLLLPNGLDKLISKFKPNLYFINISGSYLNSPKWNRGFAKRGTVEIEKTKLFSKEELETATLDEINFKINEAFKNANDLEWIENRNYKYIKKNKLMGLENIITHCPICKSVMPFEYDNESISCNNCRYTINAEKESYNFIDNEIKSLKELFDIDRNYYKGLIDNDLVLEDEARITYYESDLTEKELFTGKVRMDKNTISFINPLNESENIEIENQKIINMVITLNKSFEVPTPQRTFRIYPIEKRKSILYWNYLEMIKG